MRQSAEITLQPSPSAAALGHSRTEVSRSHQVSATNMSTVVTVQSSDANTKPFKKRFLMENRSPLIDSAAPEFQEPKRTHDSQSPIQIKSHDSQKRNANFSDDICMDHVPSSVTEQHSICITPTITSSSIGTVPVRWTSPMDTSDGNSAFVVSGDFRNNGSRYSSPASLPLYTAASIASDTPLNLCTSLSSGCSGVQATSSPASAAGTSEVQLSSLVEHLVERMLSERQGCAPVDSLGDWFSHQFDSRPREGARSSEVALVASRTGVVPPPRITPPISVTGGRGRSSGSSRRRSSSFRRRHTTGSVVSEVAAELNAVQATSRLVSDSTMELTIGMTDTINHVIDAVFSQSQCSAIHDCTDRAGEDTEMVEPLANDTTTTNDDRSGSNPNDARSNDVQAAVVQPELSSLGSNQHARSPQLETRSEPVNSDSCPSGMLLGGCSPADSSYVSGCDLSSVSKPAISSADSENSSGSAASDFSLASRSKSSPTPPIPSTPATQSVPAAPTPVIHIASAAPTPVIHSAPAAPTITTAPAAPTNPSALVAPTNPSALVAPTNPSALVAPTISSAPAAPTNFSAPAAPTNSSAPAAPTNSSAPTAPTNSSAPAAPTNSSAPTAPTKISAPVAPTISSAPAVHARRGRKRLQKASKNTG